ncbi:nitroreductase family protein [Rubinisphaera sp.]|uniref:nitroreductase family protein n=1 Tax=Rubinisphaera sp. TaxID=2024857 RepID=UPI000C114991|nr:nitroreductase family protein [Rubinisphaera sp.]MBV08802.1 hypothetical protein [Rubinisphaera sp.]|tara:strand:+ start:326 stop:964 length:639 start_codon:yes stop_codon:yes gene_type:complete
MSSELFARIVHERCTEKVLSEEPLPASGQTLADEILELAAWAPFHRPAHDVHLQDSELTALMPWRFYVLDASSCRKLREELLEKDSSNVIKMLATADCMVQVTWLPNPPQVELPEKSLFEATLENMEHLAAASAAVQNLLLAATANGIRNYWSSGGVLRSPEVFKRLGIPTQEILLGALFFSPQDVQSATIATSKLRDKRGPLSGWVKRVDL